MEMGFSKDTGTYGDGGSSGSSSKSSKGFIDRSRVRILLCDNDAKSSDHVLTLLMNCSYHVTSVKSARQVIDALNAEGSDIDIILAEVELPMAKGMKMLKYITRDKDLRRIPVIMMSAQDEVSVVVKCLRLGAADYLVKPIRTNELLNLWTHMWRRRRMLGLTEKNVMIYDLNVVGSDPSDANTTSTTLFSDDSDDKSRKSTNPEIVMEEPQVVVLEAAEPPPVTNLSECRPGVPGISDRRTGQHSLGPKKSEWKTGESSAFLTYVKSGIQTTLQRPITEITIQPITEAQENEELNEKSSQGEDLPSSSFPDSRPLDRSSTPPVSFECSPPKNSKESGSSQGQICPRNENEPQIDMSNFQPQIHSSYPYYMSGMMNQVMVPSPPPIYQNNAHGPQNHAYTHMPPQHVPGLTPYPYYGYNVCVQPSQIPVPHPWPSYGTGPPAPVEVKKVDRREATLIKFRQKRKERCFDKKIRYINRKKLAERRPRVRGQFVRKTSGMNVDLNGRPNSGDFDEEGEEEEDEDVCRDYSPEDDALVY